MERRIQEILEFVNEKAEEIIKENFQREDWNISDLVKEEEKEEYILISGEINAYLG